MTRFRTATLVILVLIVVSGCRNNNTTKIFESPTAPSPTDSPPSGVVVTKVSVSAPSLNITLNACPATIGFTATVHGTNVTQTVTWLSTGGGNFSSSGTSATLVISSAGTYQVTATSTQANVSGTVTITATGNCGGTTPPPTTPAPTTPAPTVSLTANPSSITQGQSSTLSWSSTNATSCLAQDGWSGGKSLSGSESVSPSSTRSYKLTCTGPGGTATDSATVTVTGGPNPHCEIATNGNLTPSSGSGLPGQTLTVVASFRSVDGAVCGPPWYFSSDPSKVSVHPNTGLVTFVSVGSATICAQPTQTRTEPKTCGLFTTVTPPPPPPPPPGVPSVSLSANPSSITQGQFATLNWGSTNATSCVASGGWSGSKSLSGSESVSPSSTTSYTLTCTGAGGSALASATLTVSPAGPSSVTISPTSHTIRIGTGCPGPFSFTFTAFILPSTANQGVTWSSSNSGVASVNGNGNGTVTAIVAGTTTITARSLADPSKAASATLTVDGSSCTVTPTINYSPPGGTGTLNGTQSLTAQCTGTVGGASCAPWWYSSDPSRVSVNPTSGLLQFIWNGSANVCVQWSQTQTDPRACHLWTVP